MLNKEQFKEYFNQSICPKLKKENAKLVFCQASIVIFTLLAIAMFIWSMVILIMGQEIFPGDYYFITIVIAMVLYMATTVILVFYYSNLKESIEQKILRPILLKVFEDVKFSYDKDMFIEGKYVKQSQFIPCNIFEVSGEDYLQVSAPYNDEAGREILIKVSDISVKVRRNTCDSNDKLETVENGIFGVVDYGREFKAEITGNFTLPDFDEVEVDSAVFNEKFKCYSNSKIDINKMLVPRLIDRLSKLQGSTEQKVKFHLKGSCLYFIVKKNLFKYKLKGKVDFSEAEQIYDQLYIIYEITKEMAANKNMFK